MGFGSRSLRVVVLALLLASFAAPVLSDEQDPLLAGQWSAPVDVGIVGMHAVLLRTGQVLLWANRQMGSDARMLDPSTGTVTDVPIPFDDDMHCSGQTVLADGRVLLFGGTLENTDHFYGITTILTFDPITRTWSNGGELAAPRWYPAGVQLPSGKTLIMSGESSKRVLEKTAEIYDPGSGVSKLLPRSAESDTDPYAHLFVLPGGKVFRAGPNPDGRNFDRTTKSWSARSATMNFGWRFGGAAALLPGFRILTAGGVNGSLQTKRRGDPATRTAEIIDVRDASPAWHYTGPMKFARVHSNLVTLPDGTVLAVGGAAAQGPAEFERAAELYNSRTGTWRVMASQSVDRAYHSTALLLPDGRVLSAGSNGGNGPTTVDYFSPPYLFKGARPTIESAPSSVLRGEKFDILTPGAQGIRKVALIRPGAVTHATNADQRYVRLAFTRGAGKVSASIPNSRGKLPPGYYMLFIVNDRGVPAVAPFIHVP